MSRLITLLVIAMTSCGPQAQTVDTHTGPVGPQGPAGATGAAGKDGTSCVVAPDPNGAVLTCGEASVLIRNGQIGPTGVPGEAGKDGKDGKDANTVTLPQTVNFYGTVCNGIYVLGIDNGPKFLSYGSQVFILSTTQQTIWQNLSTNQFCKIRLDTKSNVIQAYNP